MERLGQRHTRQSIDCYIKQVSSPLQEVARGVGFQTHIELHSSPGVQLCSWVELQVCGESSSSKLAPT